MSLDNALTFLFNSSTGLHTLLAFASPFENLKKKDIQLLLRYSVSHWYSVVQDSIMVAHLFTTYI